MTENDDKPSAGNEHELFEFSLFIILGLIQTSDPWDDDPKRPAQALKAAARGRDKAQDALTLAIKAKFDGEVAEAWAALTRAAMHAGWAAGIVHQFSRRAAGSAKRVRPESRGGSDLQAEIEKLAAMRRAPNGRIKDIAEKAGINVESARKSLTRARARRKFRDQ